MKISQENIDQYVASTEEFWNEFHSSLKAPFHFYHKFKDLSLPEWIKTIQRSDDMPTYLEHLLFKFPVLKGEYFIAYAKAMCLTNYRIIMNDATLGLINIPLSQVISYANNKVVYTKNLVELKVDWTSLKEDIVNSAISRAEFNELNEVQQTILDSTYYALEKDKTLSIPKISWVESLELVPPSLETNNNNDENATENDRVQLKGVAKIWHFGLTLSMLALYLATLTLPVLNVDDGTISGTSLYWDTLRAVSAIDGRKWAFLLFLLALLGDIGHSFKKRLIGRIFRTLNILLTILFWLYTFMEGGEKYWALTGIVLYSIFILIGWFAAAVSNSSRYH